MEGGPGSPPIRPIAPLSAPPTGLPDGTSPGQAAPEGELPPLRDGPTLYIPGQKFTSELYYNLANLGSKTASRVERSREREVHEGTW